MSPRRIVNRPALHVCARPGAYTHAELALAAYIFGALLAGGRGDLFLAAPSRRRDA